MRPHLFFADAWRRFRARNCERKVDFIIAGAQKGGTTALDAYLRTHPEIGMARIKEVHFFDEEKYFQTGNPPYSIYHSQFNHVRGKKVWGEATPVYMYWREAPKRIKQYNPRIKLIFILRNPIERAYSQWNMSRQRKEESLSFWDALQSEEQRQREAHPLQLRKTAYIARGFYAKQLKGVWSFIPKEQTLILKNEDLRKNPQAVLDETCSFIGVSPLKGIVSKEIHSRVYEGEMTTQERNFLKETFRADIKDLEQLLGWDCGEWLK